MSRRGENIRKRKDGRWEARIICGYGSDKKAIYHSVYGKNYSEVRLKKYAYLRLNQHENVAIPQSSNSIPAKITMERLMREWLQSKIGTIKESTIACYLNIIERHILPELGTIPISELKTDQVESFLLKKLQSGRLDGKGGLSAKTVSDIRSLLILAFRYARKKHYSCGVVNDPYSPQAHRPHIEIFTHFEQNILENAIFAETNPIFAGILVSLYGGLRIGEVCALKWKDINLQDGIITIDKTLTRIRNLDENSQKKTQVIFSSPKTSSSCRIVPLPDFVKEYLRVRKQSPDTYLLTGTARYMEPRICLEKYKKILKQLNIADHTFHALRHTFATRCVEMGFDAKSLSEILGHANVSTTMQRYVHPSFEQKKEQMQRLIPLRIQGHSLGQ